MISDQTRGIALASSAGLCWGVMSVAAQYLFTDLGFTPEDLVALRLLASGALLIAIDFLLNPRNVFAPVFRRENLPAVVFYGGGVLCGQYTFFLSIAYTNAGTAAILTATQPLMILLWLAFHDGRRITPREALCLLLALFGVFCLVTKGDLSSLDFSVAGVVFGLLSAAAGAFSTVQPRRVIGRIGSGLTAGWGLFTGGCIMSLVNPPWAARATWTWEAAAACAVVILIGTVVAFWCYLASTKFVSPAVTGLLVSFEPLSAVVLSALLLGVTFDAWELAGAGAILANLVLLSLRRSGAKAPSTRTTHAKRLSSNTTGDTTNDTLSDISAEAFRRARTEGGKALQEDRNSVDRTDRTTRLPGGNPARNPGA